MGQAAPERRKVLTCSTCPIATQELRRCREDRFDFDTSDGNLWPMVVTKGGETYGYCPGKATWDHTAAYMYQALVISAETGIMLEEGAINQQPEWWIEQLSWFLPYYSDAKFYGRARAILGDGTSSPDAKKTKGVKSGRNR